MAPLPRCRFAASLLVTLIVLVPGCGPEDPPSPAASATNGAGRGVGIAASEANPWFEDGTAAAGLSWRHTEGDEQWDIRPTMGPGVALADVDGDDDSDVFVVGGGQQSSRLFLNDGAGVFSDATAAWGLSAARGSGMGAVFGDIDGDGDQDLYVTNDGPNLMWRNDGERFTDVTATSRTGDARWGASATFADVDRDGDLDLFVANYLQFDTSLIPPESQQPGRRREDPIAMLPYVFPGQANVLYRNDGQGRFDDVTLAAGLHAPDGKSLGAVFLDHDDDGWPDLYVANDTTPNTFWHNLGNGRFEEISLWVGLDDPRGGMGLAVADVDADGDEDLLLTNWQLEPNALYRSNLVHAPSSRRFMPAYEDVAVKSGLAQASVGYVGWGCVLADLDNDGDHDVYVANGYTSPDYETTMICVGQPDQLFENVSPPGPPASQHDVPRWQLVDPARAGAPLQQAWPSRGLACGDLDGDGDLDLIVSANNGPLVLLRNRRGGRSLRVVPVGHGRLTDSEHPANADGPADTEHPADIEQPANATHPWGSPVDALGARVTLTCADGSQRSAVVRAGSGYLGQNERGVRFGLGSQQPRTISVTWPDGSRSQHATNGPGLLRVIQPLPDGGQR